MIPLNTAIMSVSQRSFLNVKEIVYIINSLKVDGIENNQITDPLIERATSRSGLDGDAVLNNLLDLRQSILKGLRRK